MKKGLFFLCFIFSFCVLAQKEAANWYFGEFCGLDFTSGEVVPLSDGQINAFEGSSSISTPEGELLFYTDGETVYNRNHSVMDNGTELLGNFSSTQSAIIFEKPGSTTQYYIFTIDAVQSYLDDGGNGLNYSIVDLAQNGGAGRVIVKNVNLLPASSEKLTGVRADDGSFWIATQYIDSFYAFKINQSGVQTTPVVTAIGPEIIDVNNIRGAMKFSPNGDKVAIAHTLFEPDNRGLLALYDFDSATGMFSNELPLADNLVYYGIEFSSNSSKLYASGKQFTASDDDDIFYEIVQFDLSASDIIASYNSLIVLPGQFQIDLAGALQLGIDKKIYHSVVKTALSVINDPNEYGFAADIRGFDISTGGRRTFFGLPSYIQSFFETIIAYENTCLGETTQFLLETTNQVTSVSWDFGDPDSGALNTSSNVAPMHTYLNEGIYEVTADVIFADRMPQQFVEFVSIGKVPVLNQDVTLIQCDIDEQPNDGMTAFNLAEALSLFVDDTSGLEISFFNTVLDAEQNINGLDPLGYVNTSNGQVLYARVYSNSRCYAVGPVTLEVVPMSSIAPITVELCNRSGTNNFFDISVDELIEIISIQHPDLDITIFLTEEDALLEVNPQSETVRITDVNTQVFYRLENGNNCVSIGTVDVVVLDTPFFTDETVTICLDQYDLVLDVGEGYDAFEWSTGETTQAITVGYPDTFIVTAFNGTCSSTKSFFVERVVPPTNIEIIVRDFSNDNKIIIETNDGEDYEYALRDRRRKQKSNVFSELPIGYYTVEVYKDGCLVYLEQVFIGGAPNFFTPNDDGFHDTWSLKEIPEFANAEVFIFDRYGKLLKQLSASSDGWDGTSRGNPLPSNDYWFRIKMNDGRILRGNFTLKR